MSTSIPLLTTKLYLPPARPNLVPRPRLTARLAEGLTKPLTLVSAPAGFGKTTLVSEWRTSNAGRDLPLAWLSLDDDDNDPTRFLTYLVAALATLQPGLGETTLALLYSPQLPPPQVVLTSLINDLGELEDQLALVLDDYHVITALPIHEALAFILDHLPPSVHLVMLTRSDPPLPLSRMRVRNQLTEIRASDLRFTHDEAATFLNRVMGLALSADGVRALEARTEGWIAGLQLAALSMEGRADSSHFITTFSGSHHYIVDYLADEVLNRQPDPVRSFLLQTSILDRLTGPLCDALTQRADGRVTLEVLEQANLFVIPLDDERRWYRYHPLFADALRNRLQQTHPNCLPDLHRRAAEWLEPQGQVAEALRHALQGGDQDRAARLVEQNALSMLMRGELMILVGWINAVESLAHERPWLSIYQCWTLTLAGQLEQAESWLQEAERLVATQGPAAEAQNMLGHLAAIRAYRAAQRGEALQAIDLAQQALECLPEGDQAIRSVVSLTLGTARRLSGDLAGAGRALEEAVRTGQAAGNLYLALGALSGLADLLFDQGRLRQASQTYNELVQLATRPDGRRLPAAGMAFFGLSMICYEWNDLEAALKHTLQSIELCQQWGHVGILMGSQVMLFRVRQALGEMDSAQAALEEAERLARAHPQTPRAPGWVASFRVRSWLAEGNLAVAARWTQQSGLKIEDDMSYLREAEYLALGRVLRAQGEFDAALTLLGRLLRIAETTGRMGSMIEMLVLQALTVQAKDDIPQALTTLERALSLAQPEGYMRVFLDEGAPMAKLLRRAGSHGIAPKYVAKLLSEFDTLRVPGAAPTTKQPLIEPLSDRELEALRLLAAGKSNQEIADELVLATGTVKRHLSNIFGKLSVQSRAECVARARELGLL